MRLSFKWRSPTTRWLTISNTSKKLGAWKPCPQTCCSSSFAVRKSISWFESPPSTSITLSRSAWDKHSAATSSKVRLNRSKFDSAIVKPAAMACPPNFWIRSGWRLETISRASRICKVLIERPEPLSKPLPAFANAMTGRWWRSLTREAKMPITPWCQSGW